MNEIIFAAIVQYFVFQEILYLIVFNFREYENIYFLEATKKTFLFLPQLFERVISSEDNLLFFRLTRILVKLTTGNKSSAWRGRERETKFGA